MKVITTLYLLYILNPFCALAHSASYVLHVEDFRTGQALRNIPCETIFTTHTGNWNDMSRGRLEQGVTNADGDFRFKGESDVSHVTYSIRTEGVAYYPVIRKRLEFSGVSGVVSRHWEPYDSIVTVRLQRVEHPIPLFVKRVEQRDYERGIGGFDGTNSVLRFDLMKGDWLPPLGNGEVADIEFTRLPHEDLGEFVGASGVKGHAYRDAVAVRFIGDGNGLVECKPMKNAALKIRTAPENGYKADYMCWRGKNQKLEYDTNRDERRCFAFRIRTRKEEHGSIVKAYYGKIYGDFIMYTDRGPIVLGVKFSYYLNPKSLDRNLEWDRVNNLCPTPGEVGRTVGDRAP